MIFITILEAFILALLLSLDTFTVSFGYGSNKIKIPFISIQIISIMSSVVLGISILMGAAIKQYIPDNISTAICFIALFILGVVKLLDKGNTQNADKDSSKTISLIEAISLATVLALDEIADGFAVAFIDINGLAIFLCSFITNTLAVIFGCYLGNKIAKKINFNLFWLSGVVLIILAFSKLF